MMEQDNELMRLEALGPEQLGAYINQLIEGDFSHLLHLLYRLDVSETKLKAVLADNPQGDPGVLIATLMLERMQQSRITRAQFKSAHDIPEEEKW